MLLASSMLELVCAQAPYNMRGLFGGCMVLVLLSSIIIGYLEVSLYSFVNVHCTRRVAKLIVAQIMRVIN